jgi:hypothetical protein
LVVVALNRRFIEWGDKDAPDPDFRYAMGLGDGALGWEKLLAKRRVVILAEAGSGKSTEMKERARLTAAAGRVAFYATVEDVGCDGLEGALSSGDRARLTAWRASLEEAWFFIDSVDEGKALGVRLEKVVRRIADGIEGAEARAHIILSGRISDWEFRKDLESVRSKLPIPEKNPVHETTPGEELLRIVRQLSRPKVPPNPEQSLVVIMTPLDRNRVRLFADAKGASNVAQFLAHVEAANLWHFARRPLDLDWLVRFWQDENRLGSLAEMVERSVTERLKETNLVLLGHTNR